ncbi:ABC transporter ATP-binding protein [Methanofollis fontis]|uniref:Cobalamin import ATP-binding protein BtuD n=1 Tax=Methanofollis fontis TaxID=2052832 RepID=A0A483CTI8_9EURY|nr:ABC transporter ATP-binding protein [Methanofollis fontis]TAJ44014.1 iron ABC transporter ATP-binding protein [Methanofollis fontis]
MMIQVSGVGFEYRSIPILRDVAFAVDRGQVVSIMGPNGVGKTTLLKCMNAILRPRAGTVMVGEEDVLSLDQIEIAKRIGYVPQRCETGRLTAFDAILLGRRPYIRWRVDEKDLRIVDAAIKKLNLGDLSLRFIDEMSGGELQKVSIARALVQEPQVLLLDEPTSSLDLKNQIEIMSTVREAVHSHNVAAVITMHDLNTALRYSDRFVFLKDRTILAAGGREIVTPDVISEVYGVPVDVETHRGYPLVIPAI